jgi:Photoprotection regulator fluorescence recovery protein
MAGNSAFTTMHDLRWSAKEKTVAHRAFDLALKRELDAVIQEAKDKAAKIKEPSELWDLEHWLTGRRREIDNKYDFRYSVLLMVFAVLLREGNLSVEDLRGLDQDKLDSIRLVAHG